MKEAKEDLNKAEQCGNFVKSQELGIKIGKLEDEKVNKECETTDLLTP